MLPPKLNHEEIENISRPVRRLNQQPKKSNKDQPTKMNSVLNSTKHKMLVKDNHLQMLPKNEAEGTLSNSFHEGCRILLPKGDKEITKKKPQMNVFMKANKNVFSKILPSRKRRNARKL